MVKIVTLFLIAMVALAVFGKLRAPKLTKLMARKCTSCGGYIVGKGPCHCKDRNT